MHDWKQDNFRGPFAGRSPSDQLAGAGLLERQYKEACPEGWVSIPGDAPPKGAPPEPESLVVHSLAHTGMI